MKKRTLCFAGAVLLLSCSATPPEVRPPSPGATAAPEGPAVDKYAIEFPKLRLPDHSFPTRYEVELTLDPARDSFTGMVSIHLAARRPTLLVWLHAQDLAIRGATFTQDGATRPVKVTPMEEPFVAFRLPGELTPQSPGVLRIDYEGKIDGERPQGVYAVSEGKGADDRYVYSLFEPLDARRAFPCFDEPGYKVPWKLSLRVRKGHSAFSNAEAVSETQEGELTKITFADTPPLPSYLIAFMAGPFETVDAGTVGREKKKLRFIVPKGRGAETHYAAQVTPQVIAGLEDYFDMPYPYSKLDVAVVPRAEGTMEHPGIVALGQPATLIKPDEESLFRKQKYANLAAHELAHYWFGDYVTMKWWDDTWLNESFAQWMDGKLTDALEPSWNFGRIRLEREFSAMQADKLATAKKLRQPVESVEDILNAFDGDLTYNKGSSVIGMMEHAVTPATWQRMVRSYMQKHAWKSTDAGDFMAVLGEVAGPGAAASFASFLNQPGFPLISVSAVCDAASPPKLKLTQQRFLPIGSTTAQGALWNVPVCVRYGAGAAEGQSCTFLNEKVKEVPIADLKSCPEWVMPNQHGLGYYVSGYSAAALDRYVSRDKAHFSIEERSAFMRDVGLLVSSGAVPLGRAMELIPDAVATGEKTTLESVQNILENVRAAELPEPLYRKYQRFVQKTFAPRARALGFFPKPGEDPSTVEMRSMLLFAAGAAGEDPGLLKTSKTLAQKWLDDQKSLAPDVTGTVLALAAHGNDRAYFDKLIERTKGASTRNERSRFLAALARFSDPALVERALALALSKDLEMRDTMAIVVPLLMGRKTRDVAYGFLKLHFAEILQKSTNFEKPFLFGFPIVYCDAAHRADAEAFFGPLAKKIDGAERVLANALESISLCEAGRTAALPSLEAFLKKY